MASPSGNYSSGTPSTSPIQNSSSEEDLVLQHVVVIDERKRKRMESNRESARRSRMKKQKYLDELMGQVAQLRKENSQIMSTINITTQHFMSVEAENTVLSAQLVELSQRLDSLDEILNYMKLNNSGDGYGGGGGCGGLAPPESAAGSFLVLNNNYSWHMNMANHHLLSQPIMASAHSAVAGDAFQC